MRTPPRRSSEAAFWLVPNCTKVRLFHIWPKIKTVLHIQILSMSPPSKLRLSNGLRIFSRLFVLTWVYISVVLLLAWPNNSSMYLKSALDSRPSKLYPSSYPSPTQGEGKWTAGKSDKKPHSLLEMGSKFNSGPYTHPMNG